MNHSRTETGVTLLELLAAMVILFILIAVGVPSFNSFIKESRLRTTTNMLVMDINYARSEAVKRGSRVVLCRSANPTSATPTCGGTAEIWTTGWIIFVDNNSNLTYDPGINPTDDAILKKTEVQPTGYTIISNADADSALAFNSEGSKIGTVEAKFAICDDRDGDGDYDEAYGREISIINTGRSGLKTGSTAVPITSCDNP